MKKRGVLFLISGVVAALLIAIAPSLKLPATSANPANSSSFSDVHDRINFAARSAALPRLRPENRAALLLLANTIVLTSDPTGNLATPSGTVRAFQRVLADPQADAAFKELISSASLVPQLYGLCGVYLTDPQSFPALVRPYESNSEPVPTLDGCFLVNKPVSKIVSADIASGVYPLRLSDQ